MEEINDCISNGLENSPEVRPKAKSEKVKAPRADRPKLWKPNPDPSFYNAEGKWNTTDCQENQPLFSPLIVQPAQTFTPFSLSS